MYRRILGFFHGIKEEWNTARAALKAMETDSTVAMLAEQERDIRDNWAIHRAELLETVVRRLNEGVSRDKLAGITAPDIMAEAVMIYEGIRSAETERGSLD